MYIYVVYNPLPPPLFIIYTGTWSGEKWDPSTSNINQVLQSICYLIFVDEPYFSKCSDEFDAESERVGGRELVIDWH